MSEDVQETVFEPCVHGTDGVHGLGLAIVKRNVEELGGTVGLYCTPGGGATFYFTLPRATL